ncbi:hypothetical protein [Marinomonas sp.]
MSVYQINYDLRNERDYKALFEKIEKLGDFHRVLESCYLVVSSKTSIEIGKELINVMDEDDGLFVTQLVGSGASCGVADGTSSWLQSHGASIN